MDYTQEQADRLFRNKLRRGVSQEEAAAEVVEMTGLNPGTDSAAEPKPVVMDEHQVEQVVDHVEKSMADKRVAKLHGGHLSQQALDDWLDTGFKWHVAASDATRQLDPGDRAARDANRLQNLTELIAGSGLRAVTLPQQIAFGLAKGEGKKAFDRAIIDPRGTMMNDINTLDEIQIKGEEAANGGKLLAQAFDDPGVLDAEPFIMESMKADLKGQDVMQAWLGEDQMDEWLQKHPNFAIPLLTAANTTLDLFFDPLLVASAAPKGFAAAGKLYARMTGKEAIWQGAKHPLAESIAQRTKFGKQMTKLNEALDADKGNVDLLRQLEVAQRNYDEVDTAIRLQLPKSKDVKTGAEAFERMAERTPEENAAAAAVGSTGPQHRNPDTILNLADEDVAKIRTAGRTVESVRREALALQAAGRDEVNSALASRGWESLSALKQDLTRVNAALNPPPINFQEVTKLDFKLRDAYAAGKADLAEQIQRRIDKLLATPDKLDDEMYDIMNKFEGLPDHVKRHLDILGYSRQRIMRTSALRRPELRLEMGEWQAGKWQGVDPKAAVALEEKRALLGPTDAEEIGSAARRLVEGAHGEDVLVHGAIIPEHDIMQQGRFADWGDGFWTTTPKDPRKIRLSSGVEVLPDRHQLEFNFRRSLGGLVPGSLHLRLPEILTNKLDYVNGGKTFINGWRQPQNAIAHTPGYVRYRAAHGQYMTHTIAHEKWYEGRLREHKFGKMDKNGRLVYSNAAAKESVRKVFHMLDAEDDIDLANKLAQASDSERAFYFEMRKWFDAAANSLGLEKGEKIRHYAPHVFPVKDILDGARPLEFIGLPVTAEVGFNHLRFRLGKTGYPDDLNTVFQVYNRGMWRKLDMEPAYNDMLAMVKDLRAHGDPSAANYLEDLVRDAKGYPAPLDQVIARDLKAAMPDIDFEHLNPATQAAMRISGLFYTGLLAGNSTYFMQNLSTAAASTAARHGMMATAAGILRQGYSPTRAAREARELVSNSGVTAQMRHSMELINDSKFGRYVDWVSRHSGIEHSEILNRGFSFHASLSEQLRKSGLTWDEAIESGVANRMAAQAVRDTEFVQHVYGRLGRSPRYNRYFGTAGAKLGTMFLSFPFKHGEMTYAMLKENPGYVMRYFAWSGMLTRWAAEGGIDISGSLGVAPLQPRINDDRVPFTMSPPVDALVDISRLSYAFLNEDGQAIEKAATDVERDLQGLAPGVGPALRWEKKWMDFASGAKRDKDFGIDRKIQRGVVTPEGQLNPDLLPTLLNLRSTEDARHQQFMEQRQQQMKANLWQMNKGMNALLKAYNKGDNAEVARIVKETWEKHGVMLQAGSGIADVEKAALLERKTRDMLANPKLFPIEMLERLGEEEKRR